MQLDEAATEFIRASAGFGPEWFLGLILVGVAGVLGFLFLRIYDKRSEKRLEIEEQKVAKELELEEKREVRKQEEAKARMEHDREMAEYKGQLVEAIHECNANTERSNELMGSLKVLMESVVESNGILHEDLKQSQNGSRQMLSDVKDMKQKVDIIYMKGIES